MSLSMTTTEREAFLADLHVGVLGVNHGDVCSDAYPLPWMADGEVLNLTHVLVWLATILTVASGVVYALRARDALRDAS